MAKKRTYTRNDRYYFCNETGELKQIKIGSEWFELDAPVQAKIREFYGNDTSEIYNVYGRPSETKVAIWNDWCRWARENDAELEICSHSCMFFSISGYVKYEGITYALYITYAHNRASVVLDA